MPPAPVSSIEINDEAVGTSGGGFALSPGARHPYDNFVSIAERLAAAGYLVLLHGRRHRGASNLAVDIAGSETDVWADDLTPCPISSARFRPSWPSRPLAPNLVSPKRVESHA